MINIKLSFGNVADHP